MKTKRIRKIFGPVLLDIVLDKDQVFPEDPGQGTPAMVEMKRTSGKQYIDSGTYWCAIGISELSGKGTSLTEEQYNWLISQQTEVENFLRI